MWQETKDKTNPVITAKQHIASLHNDTPPLCLPETAVVFFMRGGEEYLNEHCNTRLLSDKFPRFLKPCPIYLVEDEPSFCFLNGGAGAPQAADTLETLAALGVKRVLSVGMFGTFSNWVSCGDIVIPVGAISEEGTSQHYKRNATVSFPSVPLYDFVRHMPDHPVLNFKHDYIVSCDAIYRQTFFKEEKWRQRMAVGVDMETSALFTVGSCIKVDVVSILIASDRHPMKEEESQWEWTMTQETRNQFFEQSLQLAKRIAAAKFVQKSPRRCFYV